MDTILNSEGISTINQISCRVETPFDKGTGILLRSVNNFYFITAKHCIYGKKFDHVIRKEEIKIYIPVSNTKTFIEYPIIEYDTILSDNDNKTDLLIIVINCIDTRPSLDRIPLIGLLDLKYTTKSCMFVGYPKAHGNIEPISIPINYINNNVAVTNMPLSSLDSDPLYNCMGFSGSGVFCNYDNKPHFIGIVCQLREPFLQFRICSLDYINELLRENKYDVIEFIHLLSDESFPKDIRTIEYISKTVLDGINDSFCNEFNLSREKVYDQLIDKVEKNKALIIKGIAGVGKSVAAKMIIEKLKKDYLILAFRTEQFSRTSLQEVFESLVNGIEDIFKEIGTTKQILVLIDSLEAILEIENLDVIKEFLRICKKCSFVKLIATCRSYAFKDLIYELSSDFPQFEATEIPVLDDGELALVAKKFGVLEKFLNNSQFKSILQRPFYLNLLLINSSIIQPEESINEGNFRKIIWDKVIAKNDTERGRLFEKIAIERAISMGLFVNVSGANTDLINSLINDNILLKEARLGESFRPSHNIYEDIALIRFIERIYQNKRNSVDFFHMINGKEPAKRKALRLWINDALDYTDSLADSFIEEVLENNEVESYWKDEIVIAILKSKYCGGFFAKNKQLIEKDENKLLLTMIRFLKTACQEPDIKAMQTNSLIEKSELYLTPAGDSWEVVIGYINDNFDKLRKYDNIVFKLIVNDWSKKVYSNSKIPKEAKNAGEILFKILSGFRTNYDEWIKAEISKQDLNSGIGLLLNLCSVIKSQLSELINEAQAEIECVGQYNIKQFNDTVIQMALSGLYSAGVCKEVPDVVCNLAKKYWIKKEYGNEYSWAHDIERDFGVATDYRFKYFPAGIYKTAVFQLLRQCHFRQALSLICDIMNHATEVYIKSKRGQKSEIVEIELVSEAGAVTKQTGNVVLWSMYRGTVETTPYLLQSILMALENWLFSLCEIGEDWADEIISYSYDYLMKNSFSVSTTAVLASVAMAYPETIRDRVFPVLKVKQFYQWDKIRYAQERSALEPIDRDIPIAQQERYKSNKRSHRQIDLEVLVTKLQVSNYRDHINQIIDEFYSEESTSGDLHWMLALNRMDFRTFKIDEQSKDSKDECNILVSPEIKDEKVRELVEDNQNQTALMNQACGISVWVRHILEDKKDTDNTVEMWIKQFNCYTEMMSSGNDDYVLFADPVGLAMLGVRNYFNQLPKEQRVWCITNVLGVAEEIIKSKINNTIGGMSLFSKEVLETLPLILQFDLTEETLQTVKTLVFLSLVYVSEDEPECPIDFYRENLWKIDNQFAEACFYGLVEVARIFKIYPWNNQEGKEILILEITNNCLASNYNKISLDSISFMTHAHWILAKAACYIPYASTNIIHQQYVRKIFALLFEVLNDRESDKGEYINTYFAFEPYIARFLLNQQSDIARGIFSNILDCVFENDDSQRKSNITHNGSLFNKIIQRTKVSLRIPTQKDDKNYSARKLTHDGIRFIEETLVQIIIMQCTYNNEVFWSLWECLESKVRNSEKKYFIAQLFLSQPYWNSSADSWEPLKNKKIYMKHLIVDLGCFDIKSVLKLLSGIGTQVLLPDGIIWLNGLLEVGIRDKNITFDENLLYYCEKVCQRIFEKNRRAIQVDEDIRNSLLYLLDIMIGLGSSIAFNIREKIIAI